MCAGFPAGKKDAHHFVNQGDRPVLLLEVGTNVLPDSIVYPDQKLFLYEDENGRPTFSNKPIKPAAANKPAARARSAAKTSARRKTRR
jgi:uncharacterized cupin superfamily protein